MNMKINKKLNSAVAIGLMASTLSPMTAFDGNYSDFAVAKPEWGIPEQLPSKEQLDEAQKKIDNAKAWKKKLTDAPTNLNCDTFDVTYECVHAGSAKLQIDANGKKGKYTESYNSASAEAGAIKEKGSGVIGQSYEAEQKAAAVESGVNQDIERIQGEADAVKNGKRLKADTPDQAVANNRNLQNANMTPTDKTILKNATTTTLPTLQLSADGKTIISSDASEEAETSLGKLNAPIMKAVATQQENQTSNDSATSYQVQTASGETVVVTKNPCYQKTDQKCLQNYSTSWTDSNGTYHSEQVPLNTLEYLSGTTKLTAEMVQQARRQEAYTQATNSALSGNSSLKVNPIESVTSSVQEMIAYGASPQDAIMSGLLAYASQLQSSDTLKNVKAYGEGMQAIQKAKDEAVYSRTEEIQQTNGVLSAQKNKRFRPRLVPDIPIVNSPNPIYVSLITPSGQPNNVSEYHVFATVRNQKTKKVETFEVRENTPFIVEMPEWTTNPGRRTVAITYKFANSAVTENYSFSYKVGQMATAILPNGKSVSNSVTALASNRDILSYNSMGQAVAGRVKDLKWDNGMCFMEITDAKDDSNIKYPSVVVASDKVEQSACSADLKGKYISMGNVTSRVDDNGQYVYVDNSDGDQVSIMNESGYDALEEKVAAQTQVDGDKWDKETLKVAEDGTIYSALPGKLGENYLNIDLGSGKKVNVAVSVDPDTGKYTFSKADGTPYTDAELRESKGIDPDVIGIGVDAKTSLLVAYDRNTKDIISNNAFDARDTSNLSRSIIGADSIGSMNTDGSLTRNRITSALGETGQAVLGQAISTFNSAINGTAKAVASLTGNIASMGGGTFAALTAASLGNETPMSKVAKDIAEQQAVKICSTVPDRCQEAMAAAK